MSLELPPDWQAALQVMAGWPSILVYPENLAHCLDVPLEQLLEMCGAMEAGGWVQWWDDGEYLYLLLSPRAAGHLGLMMSEETEIARQRWLPADAPVRMPRAQYLRKHGPIPETIVDPSPGPVEQVLSAEAEAIRAESIDRDRQRRGMPRSLEDLPWPTIHLTGCATVWEETNAGKRHSLECRECYQIVSKHRGRKVAKVLKVSCRCGRGGAKRKSGPCSACKGLPLGERTICLRCHRWGPTDPVSIEARRAKRGA